MTTLRCPCCGASIDFSQIVLDIFTNIAIVWGHEVPLSPRETEVLSVLLSFYPKPIHTDTIAKLVYGATRWEKMTTTGIATHIQRLRYKTHLDIRKKQGSYRINLTAPHASPAPSPIRLARQRAGLSLRQLAARVGKSQTTLWEIEHGRVASQQTLSKLADVLHTPVDSLQKDSLHVD